MGESASVLFGKWHRQVVPDDAEMRHLAGYPWQVAPPQSLLPFHRIDAFYFTLISRSTHCFAVNLFQRVGQLQLFVEIVCFKLIRRLIV